MPFHLCSSSFILHLLSPLLYSTLQAKLHFGTRKGASLAALRAMKPRVSCHFPRFSPPPTATNVTNISSNCECGRRYWPVPSFLIYIYIYIPEYISSIVDCSTSTPQPLSPGFAHFDSCPCTVCAPPAPPEPRCHTQAEGRRICAASALSRRSPTKSTGL